MGLAVRRGPVSCAIHPGLRRSGEVQALSFETAPTENVAAQALWRSAKARVLVNRGDHRGAERLSREAIQLVPREMLNLSADLRVDLAEILLAARWRKATLPVINEAIDLYERKGNVVSAARARSLGRSVAPVADDEWLATSGSRAAAAQWPAG